MVHEKVKKCKKRDQLILGLSGSKDPGTPGIGPNPGIPGPPGVRSWDPDPGTPGSRDPVREGVSIARRSLLETLIFPDLGCTKVAKKWPKVQIP